MQITNITESGCNNVLLWAIGNGADVKEDLPLQSVVNDELFYQITLSDVNFFELFRLTQMYREKLRIVYENKAEVPPRTELVKLFNGTYIPDETKPDTKAHLAECVEHVTQNFLNLALQMSADDDIIKPSAVRLFLPMITRKFSVQIPVAFTDLVNSITPEEAGMLFNSNYPNTLQEIINTENHNFKVKFSLAFIQATWILKYDNRYDKYLKITKYSPLKNSPSISDKLYKFGLLGFYKYNNVTRGQVRCNLFNLDVESETFESKLKTIASIKTPLQVEFAVQLPIQYMQMLENSYSREVLDIQYESSMTNIIDSGIIYDDFITPVKTEDTEEVVDTEYENAMNNIEAYRVRITEANQLILNTISMLLNNDGDIDTTSVFSMLPSIYNTKAVITLNMDHIDEYKHNSDPLIAEMLSEMISNANEILSDINNAK